MNKVSNDVHRQTYYVLYNIDINTLTVAILSKYAPSSLTIIDSAMTLQELSPVLQKLHDVALFRFHFHPKEIMTS